MRMKTVYKKLKKSHVKIQPLTVKMFPISFSISKLYRILDVKIL